MQKDVFRAIADPTRREIISILTTSDLSMNDIAARFAMSRPAVAKHIKILTESGLILVVQQGRERICVLQAEPLHDVHQWVQQYEAFWQKKLQNLATFLEQTSVSHKKSPLQ
jgi:DNA-binding transcriptional ArsR family regulator